MALTSIPPGLYELLITVGLERQLADLDPALIQQPELHPAEAANRIAWHLSDRLERALEGVPEESRVAIGITVAQAVLGKVGELIRDADLEDEFPHEPSRVLRAIGRRQPDGTPHFLDAPLIPLLDTTLLTNAPGEPRVGRQLAAEIDSAENIDVLMAFIRTSGIGPFREALRRHCAAGRRLRVLTTAYTGSTQRSALEQLVDLGADVRISYDVSSTRLHAKAWLFQRAAGFSTAYIGSSNLTHSAQVSGLEWNVRVSGARNPDVIEKVRAIFESYWCVLVSRAGDLRAPRRRAPDGDHLVPPALPARRPVRPIRRRRRLRTRSPDGIPCGVNFRAVALPAPWPSSGRRYRIPAKSPNAIRSKSQRRCALVLAQIAC